jgi:type IV pilus assembly protein PilB
MVAEALSLRAGAIRIEPRPESLRVLYEIDGRRVDRDALPRRLLAPVVARIRSLAGLAADAGADEQAGRMRGTAHGRPFDLGVEIRPSAEGPIVVLTL